MNLFVNAFTHLDASLWCPDHGLTGASWWVDLDLQGPQGDDGMILDFGEVKPWAKRAIDAGPDHTLLVPERAEGVTVETLPDDRLCITTQTPYAMTVTGPAQAFTLLPVARVTPEVIAQYLMADLNPKLPVPGQLTLALRAEPIDGAELHYSHGLRLHQGNCQRIAHGHRSRLHIWRDGQEAPEVAARLAARWNHAYLYDQADCVSPSFMSTTTEPTTTESTTTEPTTAEAPISLSYTAAQGLFELTLPAHVCRMLPVQTTVENLANALVEQLHEIEPAHHWRVCLNEGIDKGACAQRAAS